MPIHSYINPLPALSRALSALFLPHGPVRPTYYSFQMWDRYVQQEQQQQQQQQQGRRRATRRRSTRLRATRRRTRPPLLFTPSPLCSHHIPPDSLQGLCSYLRSVIATASLLEATGVGSSYTDPLKAAVVWALRDGAGLITNIAFSHICAPNMHKGIREFRLLADVLNDLGLLIDVFLPYFPVIINNPPFLLLVMALSTALKTMCGVAATATRSDITAHFSLDKNYADLNAKEGSQEALVTLVGLSVGVYVARLVGDDTGMKLTVFVALTLLHVFANYRAVMLLKFDTFNEARLCAVVKAFHATGNIVSPAECNVSIWDGAKAVLSPKIRVGDFKLEQFSEKTLLKAKENEHFIAGWRKDNSSVGVCFSTKFDSLATAVKEKVAMDAYIEAARVVVGAREAKELSKTGLETNGWVVELQKTGAFRYSIECVKDGRAARR